MYVFVFVCVYLCPYAHALTIFIKDTRWFKLFNKPRRRRSPDGSEFRNKFPYFSESTIENKSLQQLKVCRE
jgi:polyferredoxin